MKPLLSVLILFVLTRAHAQISPVRQKQLDSLVTNVPRNILRDLDSLHHYLHQFGRNDEERVFMYYGLFGIHYRYDDQRAGNSNVKEYTTAYTCAKKSGVCRDFSALFMQLCERSHIPCVEAAGRPQTGFKRAWKDYVLFQWRKPNHAWNVVKFNGEWHLMDPTWSFIVRTEKYYDMDENGRRKYAGKVKVPTRKYYDADPTQFYTKRSTIHPAFYLTDSVYTYKSVRRKILPKRTDTVGFDFSHTLDSLSQNPWYALNANFQSECRSYSKQTYTNYYTRYYAQFVDLKRTPKDKLTIDDCRQHLQELDSLSHYLHQSYGAELTLITFYKSPVKEYLQKLEKRAARLAGQ